MAHGGGEYAVAHPPAFAAVGHGGVEVGQPGIGKGDAAGMGLGLVMRADRHRLGGGGRGQPAQREAVRVGNEDHLFHGNVLKLDKPSAQVRRRKTVSPAPSS